MERLLKVAGKRSERIVVRQVGDEWTAKNG
jgi:hypothetical protein